ncbi:hypothetical protein HYX11_04335 [Candidatus Woesearchaeota archaeon]|nr:hypothetical protein [Candidatus Woesearchaeota archaeon]
MKKYSLLIFSILSLLLISCTPSIPSEKSCTQDSDCVPATCCHANQSINKNYAPNCQNILCSMGCEPNTLDCSQGEIKCVNNECTILFNN